MGKTSLSRSLSLGLPGSTTVSEELENPYLPLFYKHLKEHPGAYNPYAFPLQVYFFEHRLAKEKVAAEGRETAPVISDRCLLEYFEVFVRNLFDCGLVSPSEFAALEEKYAEALCPSVAPKLVVFLDASLEETRSRIEKRNREGETSGISMEYLAQLAKKYSRFKTLVAKQAPQMTLLEVQTDNRTVDEVSKEVLEVIKSKLKDDRQVCE